MLAAHRQSHTFDLPKQVDIFVTPHKAGSVSLHAQDLLVGWGFSILFHPEWPVHRKIVRELALAMGLEIAEPEPTELEEEGHGAH